MKNQSTDPNQHNIIHWLPHTSTVLFLALSVTFFYIFLSVHQISAEPLNGFTPNSQGICDWSLSQSSFKVMVKGQRAMSTGTKTGFGTPNILPPVATEWSPLHEVVTLTFDLSPWHLGPCMRCMFGKTSLALVSSFLQPPLESQGMALFHLCQLSNASNVIMLPTGTCYSSSLA